MMVWRKSLEARDLDYFRSRVAALTGIQLSPAKREMLASRLNPRVEELGLEDIAEYRRFLESRPPGDPEWQTLINLVTTNKTDFFREPAHFEYLAREFLPKWEKENPGAKFRAWCAACSTGEEPYTLAMVLEQCFQGGRDFEIVASDIDTEALAHASNGVYPMAKLHEIPPEQRSRHVVKGRSEVEGWFKVRDALKERVKFRRINLMERSFHEAGDLDLILCRNVFIYFDPAGVRRITEAFIDRLRLGGALILGHSEPMRSEIRGLKSGGPSVYLKNAEEVRAAAPSGIPARGPDSRRKRILVVDDSPTFCKVLSTLLEATGELEVVGTVTDPSLALQAVRDLRPDAMTLDLMMPGMNGCDVLKQVLPLEPLPVVMVSAAGLSEGSEIFRALDLGAVDYIKKPSFEELGTVAPAIIEKLRAACSIQVRAPHVRRELSRRARRFVGPIADQVIAIGASTGGVQALAEILTALPKEIPPILIVQHIPPVFSAALAGRLASVCPFEVKEASPGDALVPGRVLIAPGGQHMEVQEGGAGLKIRLSSGDAVNRHRPSIDVLFRSVARCVGSRAVGVLLTGMGSDGAQGLLQLRQCGALTIAQDETSCAVFGMPKEAIRIGAASLVRPLDQIAESLLTEKPRRRAA